MYILMFHNIEMRISMDRVNNIIHSVKYKKCIKKIKKCEKEREYCKHNIRHFLDVSRIAYIMTLENNLGYDKEIVYAVGLLHDIGKYEQYKNNIPHEMSSAKIALDILCDAGYNDKEIEKIIEAILNHRNENNKKDSLNYIIYKADKLSRNCFCCKAEKSCKWSLSKKNKDILL